MAIRLKHSSPSINHSKDLLNHLSPSVKSQRTVNLHLLALHFTELLIYHTNNKQLISLVAF